MPFGRLVVATASGPLAGGWIWRVKLAVAVSGGTEASVTVTVKLKLPAPVGVPESVPSMPSVSPGGRLPDVTCQV